MQFMPQKKRSSMFLGLDRLMDVPMVRAEELAGRGPLREGVPGEGELYLLLRTLLSDWEGGVQECNKLMYRLEKRQQTD